MDMAYWSIRRIKKANTAFPKSYARILEYFILGVHAKQPRYAGASLPVRLPYKREHVEMEIFIKEFRTTNKLLLKTRSNLLSELKIEVNELSKVVSNVLIPKNKVKGVTTRGGIMTSEVTRTKEISETRINKNKPSRFEQDVQEKPHDDGVENKSSSIPERTTQPLKLVRRQRMKGAQLSCSTNCHQKKKTHWIFTTPCQVLEKHKEAEDLAAYHLSRFENPHMEVLTEREIADKFSDENLMVLKSKSNNDEPWYADFVNYIVGKGYSPKLDL
ncbi:hypothetical protein Tco_0261147 [Tanacetum coccineum]